MPSHHDCPHGKACVFHPEHIPGMKVHGAPFGWTVVKNNQNHRSKAFLVYKRDCPPDAAHFAADLAPFTFPTKAEAIRQGKLGNYAYKR